MSFEHPSVTLTVIVGAPLEDNRVIFTWPDIGRNGVFVNGSSIGFTQGSAWAKAGKAESTKVRSSGHRIRICFASLRADNPRRKETRQVFRISSTFPR